MTASSEHVWWWAALGFALAFACTLVAQVLDPRLLAGEGIWVKPTKFAASLAIHFATLALVMQLLSKDARESRLLAAVALASVGCAIFEQAYIAIQAWRLLPSHFNVTTPFYAALYSAMAGGAVMIVAAAGAVGIVAAFDRAAPLSVPLRTALVLGLVIGSVLTIVTAFRLGGNMGRFIGVEALGAPRLPVLGWSMTVGDLRPAHFMATHMMQAVPVAGLVAASLLSPAPATLLVWVVAAGWTAATILLFLTALAGRPFTAIGM